MSLTRPLTRPLTSPLTRAITGYAQGGGGGGSTDPYWSSVVSLLHFDGANASTTFTDQTGKTWSAYGGVQIDTAQSKFGGASGLFNGASDYITTPSTAELTFGAGDFTVEAWVRPATVSGACIVLCKHSYSTGSWIVYRNGTALLLYVSSTGSGAGNWDICNGLTIGTVAADTWYHVAWTRSGTTFETFLDGVVGATATSSSAIYNGSQAVAIGGNPGVGDYYSGHIDEVRITKGVARYTAAFTPPTAAFPNS